MYHGISGSSLLTFQEVNAWSLTVGVVLKKRLSKSSLWILDYTFTFIVYLLVGFTTDLIPPFLPGLTRNCISWLRWSFFSQCIKDVWSFFRIVLEWPFDNVKQLFLFFKNNHTDSYSWASKNASIILLPLLQRVKLKSFPLCSWLIHRRWANTAGPPCALLRVGRNQTEEAEMEAPEWENPGWSPF